MIKADLFLELLNSNSIHFYTGVPDSLLKNLCSCCSEKISKDKYIIAANEGAAVGLGAGYYLSTKNIPVVFMQNSGIGNAVNPLLSLIDEDVYRLPMLFIIGWRGEPGVKDEPQHKKQGKLTLPLLETMGIDFCIIDADWEVAKNQIQFAVDSIKQSNKPYALVIRKDIFAPYISSQKYRESVSCFSLSRERAIEIVVEKLSGNSVIVSTTGMISRELFEIREKRKELHNQDFLVVGSMGHASQIALGIALNTRKIVCCLDGDGAVIMHMGSMAINGSLNPQNFIHIVLNNAAHDSVGGQPTVGNIIDLKKIAKACGYKNVLYADSEDSLNDLFPEIYSLLEKGSVFIEVKVCKGNRKDLGRPTISPEDNKASFMDFMLK